MLNASTSGHPQACFLPVHRWGDGQVSGFPAIWQHVVCSASHALPPVLVTSNSLCKEKAELLTWPIELTKRMKGNIHLKLLFNKYFPNPLVMKFLNMFLLFELLFNSPYMLFTSPAKNLSVKVSGINRNLWDQRYANCDPQPNPSLPVFV